MILARSSGLGRGLGAIIPPKVGTASAHDEAIVRSTAPIFAEASNQIYQIPIDRIDSNPRQPREYFDHTGLEELISSIKIHGILQPIIVTLAENGRYTLIAGERRWRAAKIAGLITISACLRSATEQQKLELAIVENIQRKDLNPLEEARAYLSLQDEFNLTQDEISRRVGKSRSQVANIIRLLQLPHEIQAALRLGRISASNARTLLSLPLEAERKQLFQAMLEGNFTVRQTEARVPHTRAQRRSLDPNIAHTEQKLREVFGTKVIIKRDVRGEGEIRITFYNDEDLAGIVNKVALLGNSGASTPISASASSNPHAATSL